MIISFCKLSMKSMHPCKDYWAETNINTATKTKSKKGHISTNILQMITNIKLDLIFMMIHISFCKLPMKSMHPAKVIEWKPIPITQQQKLSRKRAITPPIFGGWLPISNLTCILQWYKLLQTLNEINASLQKLLSRNEKCDDNATYDNMDRQLDSYLSAMLRRQHKK